MHQALAAKPDGWPEVDPWDPHGRRRQTTFQGHPLTSESFVCMALAHKVNACDNNDDNSNKKNAETKEGKVCLGQEQQGPGLVAQAFNPSI